MKTALNVVFSLSVFYCMMGCSYLMQKPEQIVATNEYGFYPSTYEDIVTKWISEYTDNPASICEVTILPPEKYDLDPVPVKGGTKTYCYRVQFAFNEKNGAGVFVGKCWYKMLIRNGGVFQVWKVWEI